MNSSIVPDHGRGVVTAHPARGATVALVNVSGVAIVGEQLHAPVGCRTIGLAAVRSLKRKIVYEPFN